MQKIWQIPCVGRGTWSGTRAVCLRLSNLPFSSPSSNWNDIACYDPPQQWWATVEWNPCNHVGDTLTDVSPCLTACPFGQTFWWMRGTLCSVTLCSFWAQVVVLCRFKEHPLSSECTPPQRDCQIRSALSLNALLNTSYTLILRGNTFAPFSSKCSSAPRDGEKQVREPYCVTLCSFLEWHSVFMILSSYHPSSYF